MEGIYEYIVRKPRTVLAVIAVVTAILGFQATQIRFDTSIESLLPENAPEREFYAEVRRTFGSDEIGIIGIITDDTVFTKETFEKIKRITQELRSIESIEAILSITSILDYGADVASPPRFVPAVPETEAGWTRLRDKLANRPLYVKTLLSPDERATAIHLSFGEMSDAEYLASGIEEQVAAILERERGPEEIWYSGLPHIKAYSLRAMQRDLTRLVPVTLGVVTIVLAVSFRSFRGVFIPALTVVTAVVWTLGIMALTGGRLTVASVPLPPLLLALGTAYSLHVVAEYYEIACKGGSVREVVLETLRRTTPPVFITALTTGLGFGSLGINPIVAIREMGLYSALGIFISFLLAVVLVPAIMALQRLPEREDEGAFAEGAGRLLQRLGLFASRNRALVIVTTAVIVVVSAAMIPTIEVESSFESFFGEDDESFRGTRAIDEALGGAMAFQVVIDSSEPGTLGKIDTLRRVRDLQSYIDSLPGISASISFIDLLELIDEGSKGAAGDIIITESGEIIETPMDAATATFWESPAKFTAVMSLVRANRDSLQRFIDEDFSRSAILVRTSRSKSGEIQELVRNIKKYARRHLVPELTAHPTGTLILNASTTSTIVSGQMGSLSLAALVMFLVMSAMFLSLRVGLIAMVPNLFPIVFFFGLMGGSGVVLSLSTSVIASIVLGIAVDDTVHVMTRLSSEVHRTESQEQAMLRTLDTVGKPCLFSTIFLSLGFLVLCFSTFVPVQQFGFLAAASITMALVGDVIVLPALIATTRVITLWDVLYLRLGQDPHRTIPMFANLRPVQAKIVALMGELRSFTKDEAIVRQGDTGEEMYVILRGRAAVQVHRNDQLHVVRELGRGDVFGEMGLIRHVERTADVVALEPVEVMSVNDESLGRLQRRYPRIALKIFRNLTMILSDRLQEQTVRSVA